MRVFLAGLTALVSLTCAAADISVLGNTIRIVGTIHSDDYERFNAKADDFDQTMTVVLHSNGGLLLPTLRMGRLIRRRGWNTSVEYLCFSACAALWLAGAKRFKTEQAQIAFHSARDQAGQASEIGNRELSSYLADLGYRPEVAKFATATPPNEIVVLSGEDAKRLGISMTIVEPTTPLATFQAILAFQSLGSHPQRAPPSPKISKTITRLYNPDDLVPGSGHKTPSIIRHDEAVPCTSPMRAC
jgi:hypothetical protein